MNKKAQFYIIAAVILISLTFGLFSAKKAMPKPEKTFDLLVQNYQEDAPFAANSGNLRDFTEKFYGFAESKDSSFQLAYFYVSQANISAFSLIKQTIFINQYNLTFNSSIVIPRESETVVSMGDSQYSLNTTATGLRAIFLSEKEGSRSVKII